MSKNGKNQSIFVLFWKESVSSDDPRQLEGLQQWFRYIPHNFKLTPHHLRELRAFNQKTEVLFARVIKQAITIFGLEEQELIRNVF